MSDKLLSNLEDGVLTLTLNRPDNLNAIDFDLLDALVAGFEDAKINDDVRVVVLAGAGRMFCAGADISQMVEHTPAEWEEIVDHYLDPVRAIATIDKPVITRCHGNVYGGGLGLAIASDFRVGAVGSRYCAPFVKLALAGCDMSAGYFLPRLVGLGAATDMMLTGRSVEAEEALRIGLISRLVPEAELDSTIAELAKTLAGGAPKTTAFTKRAIRRSLEHDMETEFDYEIFAQVQCLQSEDHKEGVSAFLSKRAPVFGKK